MHIAGFDLFSRFHKIGKITNKCTDFELIFGLGFGIQVQIARADFACCSDFKVSADLEIETWKGEIYTRIFRILHAAKDGPNDRS